MVSSKCGILGRILACFCRCDGHPEPSPVVPEDDLGARMDALSKRYVSRIVIRFTNEFAKQLVYQDGVEQTYEPFRARWNELREKYKPLKLILRPGITTISKERIEGTVRLAIERARDVLGRDEQGRAKQCKQEPVGVQQDHLRFLRDYVANPPNFFAYFFTTAPDDIGQQRSLVQDLRAWDAVEFVYVDRPAPPPGPTSFDGNTGAYVNPAPNGVNAISVDAMFDGSSQKIAVIDQGWWASHPELPGSPQLEPRGAAASSTDLGDMSHGTAILGMVVGRKGTGGMSGLAPAATARIVGFGFTSSDDATRKDQRVHDAIMQLLPGLASDGISVIPGELDEGDVMLVEAQVENRYSYTDTNGNPKTDIWFMPAEQQALAFHAIHTAATAGIVAVEPAGNFYGGPIVKPSNHQNLDDVGNNMTSDSGAIIVGAIYSDGTLRRLRGSNFGDKVDCYAPGDSVPVPSLAQDTNLNIVDVLYQNFSNGLTSAAAAIIAGAALMVQGKAQQSPFGGKLRSHEMRQLLRNTSLGSAVVHPSGWTPAGTSLQTRSVPNLDSVCNQVQTGVIP